MKNRGQGGTYITLRINEDMAVQIIWTAEIKKKEVDQEENGTKLQNR